jgi:hypothetical protein
MATTRSRADRVSRKPPAIPATTRIAAIAAVIGLAACATVPPGDRFTLSEQRVLDAVSTYDCPPDPDLPGLHVTTVCAIQYSGGSCVRTGAGRAHCRWRRRDGHLGWCWQQGDLVADPFWGWTVDRSRPQRHIRPC